MLLAPCLGRRVVGLWIGSVLIDADHYAWFCVNQRSLDPTAAVRYFNQAQSRQNAATRALHAPPVLAAVALAGVRWGVLLPVALGMGLHVALDAHHEARMTRTRTAVLERDQHSCRACGLRAPDVGTHVWRQPRLLPSYGIDTAVSLCGRCHAAAHAAAQESRPWK